MSKGYLMGVLISVEPPDEVIEAMAEQMYGHPRSSAIAWAKEDKFESCVRQAREMYAVVVRESEARLQRVKAEKPTPQN
jgi:hypothetical protein